VHLSDLHLTARDDEARSEPRLLGKLVGMNGAFRAIVRTRAVQKADLVLVTGDVTDTGKVAEWGVFWDAVRGAGLRRRVLVIPGNHDVCALGLRVSVLWSGYSKRDLAKAVKGLKMGHQPVKFPWARQVDPRVVLFGLNSNNLGNWSGASNALGELSHFQMESFARLLRKHSQVPVKIVALHHSPNIPGKKTARKRKVPKMGVLSVEGHQIPEGQRRSLRLLCVTQGVRLIVHGHLHRREDRRINGIRVIGIPASTEPTTQRKLSADYLFPTYTVRGHGGRVNVTWNTVRC
jgi:3',5'-cyclic AMP phosphodiesterase CpdA